MSEKITPGTKDQDRLMIVQKMLSKGFSSSYIRSWLGKEYNIGTSQQYKIIKAAREDLVKYNDTTKEEIALINESRLEELLMRSVKNNTTKDDVNAIKIIDTINKMYKVYDNEDKSPSNNEQVIKIKFGE